MLGHLGEQLARIANLLSGLAGWLAGAGLFIAAWLVLAWLLCAGLVAWAARERGRSALLWLVLALLLTPLLAGLMLLLFPAPAWRGGKG